MFVDLPDFEFLLYHELPDVMILHLNVLRLRMVDGIVNEVYHTLVGISVPPDGMSRAGEEDPV